MLSRSAPNPAFHSPALQKAILTGRQPAALTLDRIVTGQLPLDWEEQEAMFPDPGEA